jgi:hypothetical protein
LQTPEGIDLRHVLIFAWLNPRLEMVCERPPAAFGGSPPQRVLQNPRHIVDQNRPERIENSGR